MTSCEEAPAVAPIQENPQGPILTDGDLITEVDGPLKDAASADFVLKLEDYKSGSEQIPVVKLGDTENLPAGSKITYELELSNSESFARTAKVELKSDPGSETPDVYYADAENWNEAHVYLFGKSPKEKTVYYRVPAYIDVNGNSYRYGAVDYYALSGSLKETCFDMGFVIEEHYYLLGNATTWSLDDAENYAFEHSNNDVYDDPVFVIRFTVSDDQLDDYWKIAPQSAVDTGNWDLVIGVENDGDEAFSGRLLGGNPGAGKITQAGDYKMTINMEAMTYEIEYLAQPDILYTPGGSNGWNQEASSYMQLCGDKELYYGVFPVNNQGFKICAEPNWNDDTTYGAEFKDASNSGTLVTPGENILPETLGLNWISAKYDPVGYNLTTYELTAIESVGVVGSFAASGWNNDVLMTSSDEGKTWIAEVEFKSGDKYKFRFNGGWECNLGGNAGQLTLDGSDMEISEDGTYVVTLNLGSGCPSCSLAKK